MSQDALGAQFPKPKKPRLLGYYFYGHTDPHTGEEIHQNHPAGSGTLCTTCFKHATKGHTYPDGSKQLPTKFHKVEEIRGKDEYDIDVCNDCGKTIRKGTYL